MSVRTPPKARPGAVGVSLVLALLLVGVAVVAVRDLAVTEGWATGTPWTLSLLERLDGLAASSGLAVGGVVAVLLGLLLVVLAVKPAPTTHLRAVPPAERGSEPADADLWLSSAAVAALAQNLADRSPGVISAEATRIRRRRITIEAVTTQDRTVVTERVESALATRLQGLTRAAITVRTREVPR